MTTQLALLSVLALVSLGAAGYAQLQLGRFTAGRHRHIATRGVLIAVALLIGLLGSRELADPVRATVAFALGFGVVHIPAACILLLKRLRGEAPS